jgi:uncharacterized membrane protein YgdD (TMEM256/DUF423 family)
MTRIIFCFSAILGFLSVAMGAFATHSLKGTLSPQALEWVETASKYQMYHALALGLVGMYLQFFQSPLLKYAAASISIGIIIFSGSLYLLAAGAPRFFGAIVPIGGTLLLIGWSLVFLFFFKKK